MPWGVVSASMPVNNTHWVWNGHVPLHEWNSGREWKNAAGSTTSLTSELGFFC